MALDTERTPDGFADNPGRIFGIYAAGFFGLVILLWLLAKLGVPNQYIGYSFVGLTLLAYGVIGFLSRTAQVDEYYVAGRKVPAVYNGMATAAADWTWGASFIAMAGTLYLLGYDALAFVLGWAGGYVLMAVLIAPYLRKSGAYTLPDFLAKRFDSHLIRFIGVLVVLAVSFALMVALIRGTGLVAERFLGVPYNIAVYIGLATILLSSILGGMRAVTWTQVAQYIVLVIAFLVPVIYMAATQTGGFIQLLLFGPAVQQITALETDLVNKGLASAGLFRPYLAPFSTYDPVNFFALVLCLMVGTASLPHLLMRFFTTPSVREARKSVAWALFFIFLLFFMAPAYVAFTKLAVYQNVIGASFDQLPGWVYIWGAKGKVELCGAAAVSLGAVKAACAGKSVVALADFRIANDVLVIAAPQITRLPFVITGLVGAGVLAAALSTASALLLAMSNALSHDIYFKLLDKKAPDSRHLTMARIILFCVAVLGGLTAIYGPTDIVKLVAWAFSIAAAGNFAALVMGIWSKRTTAAGAICGMIAGLAVTLGYLYWTAAAPLGLGNERILGIDNISAAIFGLPVAFLVTWIVSMGTPAPSAEMQEIVDEIRRPRREVI